MKKVLFIMLIVVLLVAFAAPVLADKDGIPNDNANWGQLHKNNAPVNEGVASMKGESPDDSFGKFVQEWKEANK